MVSHKNYNLSADDGFAIIFLLPSELYALQMVSLRKGNPNQLFIYSMEVYMYIGFWTLKMKCTQSGSHGQVAFKNARVMSRSGGRGSSFFGVAPTRRLDACNTRRGYCIWRGPPLSQFLNQPIQGQLGPPILAGQAGKLVYNSPTPLFLCDNLSTKQCQMTLC